jgi:hypothetical protein
VYLGRLVADTNNSLPSTLVEPSVCHHILFLWDSYLYRQSFYMGTLASSLLQNLPTKFSVPSSVLRCLLHITCRCTPFYRPGSISCTVQIVKTFVASISPVIAIYFPWRPNTQLMLRSQTSPICSLWVQEQASSPQEIKSTLFFIYLFFILYIYFFFKSLVMRCSRNGWQELVINICF